MSEVMLLILWGWGMLTTGLYHRERRRSRDYATELSQLIHDHDLTTDGLRRSMEWDDIRGRAEKQEGS